MTEVVLTADDRSRLEELRADLEELRASADPSLPAPAFGDAFLARLVLAGSAYATLPRKVLAECGLSLRPPEQLRDEELPGELWRVIWAMALLRLLLDHTDHLGDRELYERLWHVELMEPATFKPGEPSGTTYVCDLLGGHSQDELRLLLTYYADRLDEEERRGALARLEGPPPEPRPRRHDRDRLLP